MSDMNYTTFMYYVYVPSRLGFLTQFKSRDKVLGIGYCADPRAATGFQEEKDAAEAAYRDGLSDQYCVFMRISFSD